MATKCSLVRVARSGKAACAWRQAQGSEALFRSGKIAVGSLREAAAIKQRFCRDCRACLPASQLVKVRRYFNEP